MAYPTPHIYYSTGSQIRLSPGGSNEPAPGDTFLESLNFVLGQQDIPQTIGISYGINELELPLEYTTTVCDLFVQLGAHDVNALVASSDDGMGARDRLRQRSISREWHKLRGTGASFTPHTTLRRPSSSA